MTSTDSSGAKSVLLRSGLLMFLAVALFLGSPIFAAAQADARQAQAEKDMRQAQIRDSWAWISSNHERKSDFQPEDKKYEQQVKNALDLLNAKQTQSAMQAAEHLVSKYPNRWKSYGVKGAVLQSQNKLADAKLAYQRAMDLAPNDAKFDLAEILRQINYQMTVGWWW